MRASTAYFAGAATVIAAIAGGLGGGLLIAEMVNPKSPTAELTKLEQRMSSQPIDPIAVPLEPAPNPAAASPSTIAAAPAAPAPETPAQDVAPATPAAETVAAPQPAVAVAPPESKPSPPAQKKAAPEASDAFASAKDTDVKRAATEKRRSERRRQWSERRRHQRRQDPDQGLRAFEAKVREETEHRRPAFDPRSAEAPRIRLFGLD
ncbi:hypothetical protein [Bradyrhizobium sp.]|uniref:hypothetical protein n=1 Tax=Bradyrhizobium sp. TaxID=376 RepID=UPI0027324A62|nr:hypothetical protein [Bradyrhizobium sp.]MDP3689793.1 hypothetical protein [Bradyrhizobium sp.]